MVLSRRASWFLLAVGVWTWLIWPRFLLAIWRDDRAWDSGPTSFLLVHVVLIASSLAIGTTVGWIGVRGLRGARSRTTDSTDPMDTTDSTGSGEPVRRGGTAGRA